MIISIDVVHTRLISFREFSAQLISAANSVWLPFNTINLIGIYFVDMSLLNEASIYALFRKFKLFFKSQTGRGNPYKFCAAENKSVNKIALSGHIF